MAFLSWSQFKRVVFLIVIIFSYLIYDRGNDVFILLENQEPSYLATNEQKQTIVQNAKRLPSCGKNFQTYSRFFSLIGRTHVHNKIRDVLLKAYKILETTEPTVRFTYGETGWKNGGRFWPHKTHRNGMCVDFIVPVIALSTKLPATLSTSLLNGYGYGVRFDQTGHYKDFFIHIGALIHHLQALKIGCTEDNVSIKRVIIDPEIQSILQNHPSFPMIQDLPFMKTKAWFPHDSHYHIDFDITENKK